MHFLQINDFLRRKLISNKMELDNPPDLLPPSPTPPNIPEQVKPTTPPPETKILINPPGTLNEITFETLKFHPSTKKDFQLFANVVKVFVTRGEGTFTITTPTHHLLTTATPPTTKNLFSRIFPNNPMTTLFLTHGNKCLMKLDINRGVNFWSRLRFAVVTGGFGGLEEEGLGVVFKEGVGCWVGQVVGCCSTETTYTCVGQSEGIGGWVVKSRRGRRDRAEFMVKATDGAILAFIDKERKCYTLTLGEGLKPVVKGNLVAFVVAMDLLDRSDTSPLCSCYLRPSTYVLILFLFLLFFMIGAFLFHFITAMILAWPGGGCSDEVHVGRDNYNLSNGEWVGERNVSVGVDI